MATPKKTAKKKPCKCKKRETPTIQTSFINYQSGNDDKKVMDKVFLCLGELSIALAKHKIRLYSNLQIGVPHNPCGLPGYPKCPKE